MDQVIPEKVLKEKKTKKPSAPISGVPRVGKDIKLYVGESLDFSEMVRLRGCFAIYVSLLVFLYKRLNI